MTPSTEAVLTLLAEAGEAGLTSGDLARRFSEPTSLQRRTSWVNQYLGRFRARGYAVRSPRPEPSAYYQNNPVWRWFVTRAGLAYLADGMEPGLRARARAAAETRGREKASREQRQAELLRDATATAGQDRCTRDAEIRHLRAEGCVLEDIGAVYGITRERARQIAAGTGVNGCRTGQHDYAGTPCAHGIVTPAATREGQRVRRWAKRPLEAAT